MGRGGAGRWGEERKEESGGGVSVLWPFTKRAGWERDDEAECTESPPPPPAPSVTLPERVAVVRQECDQATMMLPLCRLQREIQMYYYLSNSWQIRVLTRTTFSFFDLLPPPTSSRALRSTTPRFASHRPPHPPYPRLPRHATPRA